jgi:hypothetical protein
LGGLDLNAILSAGTAIIVAVLSGFFARDLRRHKKHDAENESRARERAEELTLSMNLMNAAYKLSLTTSLTLENEALHDTMLEAREAAKSAHEKYWAFVNSTVADKMYKADI